ELANVHRSHVDCVTVFDGVVIEKLLNQCLQAACVLSQNAEYTKLLLGKWPGHLVAQQRLRFHDRRKRCFQLMSYVVEKSLLLPVRRRQLLAHPFQAFTECDKVSRTLDVHRALPVLMAYAVDGGGE